MKKLSALLCIFLCLLLVFSGCAAPAEQYQRIDVRPYSFDWEDNGDIEKVRVKIVEGLLNPDVENVQQSLDALKADGSFSNVDYDGSKTDTWHPIEHLKNVLDMQIAYNTPEHPLYKNEELKHGVKCAMEYWAANDFKCEWNWWWNQIGVGLYLPDIILLGVDGLTRETKTSLLKNIKQSLLQNIGVPENIKEREVDSTGGNLTDQAILVLKIAVIENDANTIMWVKSLLENELRVFPSFADNKHTDRSDCEGIKEDMSFQQHDQLIYFGGYGDVFMDGIIKYLTYTKGTQFELSQSALNVYADFLLDGIQYAVRNGFKDFNTSGRSMVRKNEGHALLSNLTLSAEVLLSYDNIERADELRMLLKNRKEQNDLGAGGYRYFYESDTGIYNGQSYMASVRHASDRTRIYEEINGENPLGFYAGLGGTLFYVDGDEYYNALPLFDWNRFPGTTSRQNHIPVLGDMSYSLYNDTNLVGGASNGSAGVSYIKSRTQGVNSTKAYFMFEDGVVCLGTDISSNKQDKLITNINQTRIDGDVTLGKGSQQIKLNELTTVRGVFDYIYHNKISYISSNELTLQTKHVKGDWKNINTHFAASSPIEGDMFTLDIFHGSRPKNAKYDYTVLMNTTPEKTQEYVDKPTLLTLKNDSEVQAVYDNKSEILCAVFHEASEIILPDKRVIKADAPCIIVLDNDSLNVASCTYDSSRVNITINDKAFNLTASKDTRTYKL